MAGLPPAQQADQFLDAYASERQRAQAVRCLGWIALRLGPGELTWWKIPDLAPAKSIRTTRRLVMLAVLAVDAVVVAATTSWAGAVIFLAVSAFLLLGGRRRPPVRRTVPLTGRDVRRISRPSSHPGRSDGTAGNNTVELRRLERSVHLGACALFALNAGRVSQAGA